MPDPVLYTQAMAVAAVVSMLCVLTTGLARSAAAAGRMNLASVLALGMGLLAGYRVLHLRCAWPPVNGLDRLLTLVLPAAFVIEVLAGSASFPRWIGRCLRIGLVLSCGRILLHASIYLGGSKNAWTTTQAFWLLFLSCALLGGVWWAMNRLADRGSDTSILWALALATQTTAITVMLEGYVTGGAAALPLTPALIGTSLGAILSRKSFSLQGCVGIGVLGLFGLLFVGRWFGGLSTLQALTIFLAPVLCWLTEVPPLSRRPRWVRNLLRQSLVAIPLVVVLIVTKRSFDRDTRPLLGAAKWTSRQ